MTDQASLWDEPESQTDESAPLPDEGESAMDETQRIVGGLIAAGGIGLIVLAIASLQSARDVEISGPSPYWSIVPAALAIAILFYVVNPLTTEREAPTWLARVARFVRVLGTGIAVALIILAAALFAGLAAAPSTPAQFDRFVMQLPSLPADVQAPAIQGEPPANPADTGATATATASAPAAQPSFLMWSVKRERPKPPSGVLPTFLGAILIIGFGIWFPHLGLARAKFSADMVGKLVAPLLSLGLVGVGASQHAQAERIQADSKLTDQGLPAYITLPANERAIIRERIYLPDPQRVSPETIEQLRGKIVDLQQQIDLLSLPKAPTQPRDTLELAELKSLNRQLSTIQVAMTRGTKPAALTQANIDSIATAVANLNGQPKVHILTPGAKEVAQADACEGVRAQIIRLDASDPQITPDQPAAKPASKLKAAGPENAFQRSWYWFKGKPSPAARQQLANQRALLTSYRDTVCGSSSPNGESAPKTADH